MFWKSFYADDIQPEIQVAPPGQIHTMLYAHSMGVVKSSQAAFTSKVAMLQAMKQQASTSSMKAASIIKL